MTVSLWTGTTGRLDKVPVEDVLRFENEFLEYLRRSREGILDGIRESRDFTDDTNSELEQAYDAFLEQFETSEGGSIHAGTDPIVDATTDDELEQEQIVKQKRG
jgi:F-type H+-transporting ATPase subunit alpha